MFAFAPPPLAGPEENAGQEQRQQQQQQQGDMDQQNSQQQQQPSFMQQQQQQQPQQQQQGGNFDQQLGAMQQQGERQQQQQHRQQQQQQQQAVKFNSTGIQPVEGEQVQYAKCAFNIDQLNAYLNEKSFYYFVAPLTNPPVCSSCKHLITEHRPAPTEAEQAAALRGDRQVHAINMYQSVIRSTGISGVPAKSNSRGAYSSKDPCRCCAKCSIQ